MYSQPASAMRLPNRTITRGATTENPVANRSHLMIWFLNGHVWWRTSNPPQARAGAFFYLVKDLSFLSISTRTSGEPNTVIQPYTDGNDLMIKCQLRECVFIGMYLLG